MEQRYLKTTRDLIRIPSTAENREALFDAIRFVKGYFDDTNARITKYEHCGKPSIVIATEDVKKGKNGTRDFDVILLGHLDVVGASKEMFVPRVEDGKLFGRGAADMKSEVAVMMEVMKETLVEKQNGGIVPKVALMLTSDEEQGGANGTGYLVDEMGYRAKAVFVPDGGEDLDEVIITAKGFAHIRISGEGISAHGSRPWLGENAILKVVKASQSVHVEFSSSECCDGVQDENGHWHSTCVFGKIAGGTAVNTVPQFAECDLGVRFVEPASLEDVFARVKELAEKEGCRAELLAGGEMRITEEDNEILAAYRDIVKRETGTLPRLQRTHGADDGRFFSQHGIPVIMSRPSSGGQHSDNEWVDLSSLNDFYRICKSFIKFF
jgi:succinyl-diaminopimelate desuccinylase